MAEEKSTVVVNRSASKRFHLKGGRVLGPGESIEVSGKERDQLLGYREIVDADKLVVKKATPAKADVDADDGADEKKKGKGKK